MQKYLNDKSLKKFNSKVAVLLAAHNGLEYIEKQILSIKKQKDVFVKIFISVDKSDDGTYEWCKLFEKKNSYLEVLPYGEYFGGAAKNFFRLIKDVNFEEFDYIALSDQDDLWMDNKLSYALNKIWELNCDAVSSDVLAFWKNGNESLVKKSWPQKKYDFLFESAGPGCTYVFKSSKLLLFKNFMISNWNKINKISLHDWIIYAYFRSKKFIWHIDAVPLIKYRQHENNDTGANYGLRAYLKRIFLIKNKWYRNEVTKICDLVEFKVKINYLFRIKNFWQLRRRPRDTIVILLISIFCLY